MDDPWLKKSTGRPPYLQKGLVLYCLLKVRFKMPLVAKLQILQSNMRDRISAGFKLRATEAHRAGKRSRP